jgi:hypothetical protein
MFEKMTYQQNLKDYGVTTDQVKECFNCTFTEIDSDGESWIEGPQRGHWLGEPELETLAKFVEARM